MSGKRWIFNKLFGKTDEAYGKSLIGTSSSKKVNFTLIKITAVKF